MNNSRELSRWASTQTPLNVHHMEQVVHHFGPQAVPLHFQIKGGVHVHRHRLNLPAAFAEQREERADRLVADPWPIHSTRVRSASMFTVA